MRGVSVILLEAATTPRRCRRPAQLPNIERNNSPPLESRLPFWNASERARFVTAAFLTSRSYRQSLREEASRSKFEARKASYLPSRRSHEAINADRLLRRRC